jgi:AIPR protein
VDVVEVLADTDLPEFLRSPEAFSEHLGDQLSEQNNPDKGDSFLAFACKVLPLCDFWRDLGEPFPNPKKTHDGGVDFEAKHRSSNVICAGQSKYKIREVEAFDSIMSKFKNYEHLVAQKLAATQGELFPPNAPTRSYVVVTSSKMRTIRKRYEESSLPSLVFYRLLLDEDRLQIVDGERLLKSLQSLYRQSYLIAPEIELSLSANALRIDNVYISVVSGKTLRSLYGQCGSSLFFENIRDFLGISGNGGDDKESNVNDAIAETLKSHPRRMLGRNNGITFRADSVEVIGERLLRLRGGSIVNGCQTTMCVVGAGEKADDAVIMTKIVTDDDSWEVAKSANYQNRVTRIDLEIARFLRPQLVRKVATDLGYGMSASKDLSISNVLDDIHLTKISHDAIKLLYLGMFSRHPNNLFEGNYSEVRVDTLTTIGDHEKHEYVMRVLFGLWVQLGRARDALQARFRSSKGDRILEVFKRFFEQDKMKYQCLLAIVTACGCVGDNLMDRSTKVQEDCGRILQFIARIEVILLRHKDYFDRVFLHAFGVISERILQQSKGDMPDVMQKMFDHVVSMSGAQFGHLCMALQGRIITDDSITNKALEIESEFSR